MAPKTIPGSLGLRRGSAIDSGTLARTPTAPPGVIVLPDLPGIEGKTSSKEITRAMAYADDSDGRELGRAYFVVNDDKLRQSDVSGLDRLVKSLQHRISEGFKIQLMCEGSADYRGRAPFNKFLGQRRAESVARFLMDSAPGVVAVPASIGDSTALRPKGGKLPSLSKIKNDRRVTIKIAADGLLPPVRLAVKLTGTGKLKDQKILERREINNGGRVVPMKGSTGDTEARKEIEYNRSFRVKEKPGPYDPFRAVTIIRCRCSDKPASGAIVSVIKCDVVHERSGKVLFSGSATGRNTDPGLEADLYAKLKGRHKNITERVRVELGRK